MKPLRLPLTLLFCALVRFGLALNCEWNIISNQQPDSAHHLGVIQVSEEAKCLDKCCEEKNCDAAVFRVRNETKLCELLSCLDEDQDQDQDLCASTTSSQFSFYRRKRDSVVKSESSETNNIKCRLQMKVGSCRAAFPRFYYDVTNQSCRSFIYGGCGANGNNFNSQEECEATCSGVTGSVLPEDSTPPPPSPETFNVDSRSVLPEMSALEYAENCEVEPEVGPCRAAFTRWYYNKKSDECKSFIYGGCKGNKNNYVTELSCKDTCAVSVLPSSKKSKNDDVSTEYRDECMVPPDSGPCRAAFPHFYFDHKTGTCQSFLYGGCNGNANRYRSMEECKIHCSNDGYFHGHGQGRNHWTAAIFLFITLAVISALLLATLVLISLRRRRLSRRPSHSDKEELLPDEQSSVDSLTLPPSPKPEQA